MKNIFIFNLENITDSFYFFFKNFFFKLKVKKKIILLRCVLKKKKYKLLRKIFSFVIVNLKNWDIHFSFFQIKKTKKKNEKKERKKIRKNQYLTCYETNINTVESFILIGRYENSDNKTITYFIFQKNSLKIKTIGIFQFMNIMCFQILNNIFLT